MVGILRRTAIFDELVKRFVAGQSVIRVADWVYESKPKGLEDASYGTLRVYLTALRTRIRQDVIEQIQQNHEPSPSPEPVQAQRIAKAIQMTPMPPHRMDFITSLIDEKLRSLVAADGLRALFLIQMERVQELRTLERRTGSLLLPNGFKEIESARNILNDLAKIELAGDLQRSKGVLNSIAMQPSGSITPRPDDLATFATFNAIDRNLARAAVEHVINMFREGDSSGGSTSTGAGKADLRGATRD